MRLCRTGCVLAIGVGFLARPSRADTPTVSASRPSVAVDLDGCKEVDQDEVRRIVSVELRAQVRSGQSPPDIARVVVDCSQPTTIMRLEDPLTRKTVQRSVDMSFTAQVARARLLALSIAELVSASWAELQWNPNPLVDPSASQPLLEARRAALDVVRDRVRKTGDMRLLALASSTVFFGKWAGAGGGLRIGYDFAPAMGFVIDGSYIHGSQATALGRASIDTVGAAAAVVAVFHFPSGVLVRAGAGARAGEVWIAGIPFDSQAVTGQTLKGPFWGPMLTLSASTFLYGRWTAELTLDGGFVLLPVAGNVGGVRSVKVDGTYAGGALGVGFAF